MDNYTATLVEFADKIKLEDLPIFVIEQSKLFIADYYAASFAGYRINKNFNSTAMALIREEDGCEEASILLEDRKFPVCNAAFMNAMYAHGADMDDGNRKSAGHIATHVMSAVFAMGEKLDVTWGDIIVAINVGYEFFNRIAGAAQPGLYNKGFHSTGVAGAMACAASCAKLLELDMNGIYNSVSLGAIQSSGLIIIDESGQGCKPINPANAARVGVFSAMMAEKGIESSRNSLESKKGWFNAFADSVNEEILLGGLGTLFTIFESYLKLYPTCRHTHSCIDAAIELRKYIGNDDSAINEEIEKINVFIYPSAIKSAGRIIHPKSQDEAKFSISYAMAVAFCKGTFSLDDLNVDDADGIINKLSEKIELSVDNSMENREKGIRGVRVKVTLRDKSELKKTVLIPKGEGAESLEWSDMQEKMMACSKECVDIEVVNKVIEKCKSINPDDRYVSILTLINNAL